MRALLLVGLIAAAGLAGCFGDEDGDRGDATTNEAADVGIVEQGAASEGQARLPAALPPELAGLARLTSEDRVEGPTPLRVGRAFTFEHTGPILDGTWELVVGDASPRGYLLAPNNADLATYEAQWQWVGIGVHDANTLTETIATGAFAYYDWPLYDGLTWSSTWGLGSGGVRMSHQATFNPAIDTGNGTFPGYDVTATADDGTVWSYDYVPAIGWMTRIGPLDEAGEPRWCICMRGWQDDWSGTYYTATSQLLTSATRNMDLEPGEVVVEPEPHVTFTVPDGLDRLFVSVGAWSEAGASVTRLVDPDGNEYVFQVSSTGTDETSADWTEGFLEPVAGTWDVTFAGAGGDTGGWVTAYATDLTEHALMA